MEPLPRNYYPDKRLDVDGLKFRLASDDLINNILDQFKGAVYDQYGRVKEYREEYRLLNNIGIHNLAVILKVRVSKNVHLTNYENKDEVGRQIRAIASMLSFVIIQNKKIWGVKDKDLIQHVLESAIFDSMKRAAGGFENDNISKNWQVSQYIDQSRPPKTGQTFNEVP